MTEIRNSASQLVQRAINMLETASCFNNEAAMKCHEIGLQGEKRRTRYLYREMKMIVTWMRHNCVDVFDPCLELKPNAGAVDVASMADPKTCMRKIIDTLWTIYNELHVIANEMVMAKLRPLSCPLYKLCDCIYKIIGEMNRNYRSYEMSGWNWHHISRHQEEDCNIHDKYEEKEESQGYYG